MNIVLRSLQQLFKAIAVYCFVKDFLDLFFPRNLSCLCDGTFLMAEKLSLFFLLSGTLPVTSYHSPS